MTNFKSQFITDNKVASTIHFINMYIRAAIKANKTKKCDSDYFVMNGNTVELLINTYQNKAAKSALVVDDLGYQAVNRLTQESVKDITLCLARVPISCFAFVKNYLQKKVFKDFNINIISLEELTYMKVDLVIANLPYGKIGANITKKIIDTVDFVEYVNLLPANDYKRNDSKDLYNYQSDMISIKDGFADAAVTTHLAKIHKNKVNSMTLDEFERSQYIDRQLDKYFEENSKRIMTTESDTSILNANKTFDVSRTFIIGWRDPVHKHMPYKKNVTTYKWNVEESVDFEYVVNKHLNKANNSVPFGGLIFKSAVEKQNYSKFIYSKDGFRFISKIFTAVQSDMLKTMSTYFTKVDWTRSWIVEEILADYGYTEDEIKEVIDDLKNYKGMED